MKTNTQTIWQDFLGMDDFLPPKPPKTLDDDCWLCGGKINGQGWGMKKAMGAMFTGHDAAKATHSQSVCGSCAALTSRDAYQLACDKHGHSPYFPIKEGKKQAFANWMFFSHVFSADGWVMPDRAGMRDHLLNPPKSPFVMTLAAVGKKHVLFRAPVNYSANQFTVQFDENPVVIEAGLFKEVLAVFERGYNLGFSKESLVTGQYNTAQCMKVGVNVWRELEETLAAFRMQCPGVLKVAGFCAVKES